MRKRFIELSESRLRQVMEESLMEVLSEDGAMGGDAATPGATSASSDRVGAFDVPFGAIQRRKVYAPNGKDEMDKVNMKPAMKRHDGKGGSISIPKDRR